MHFKLIIYISFFLVGYFKINEGTSRGDSDTKIIGEQVDEEKEKEKNPTKKTLAKILSEKYTVDLLVYHSSDGHEKITENFQIIYLPISITHLNINTINRFGMPMAMSQYHNSDKYYFFGVYSELLSNEKIQIGGIQVGIRDYLKEQNYSLGISEFEVMGGAFAVFEALGIEKTFAISSSIFFPQHLQFLEIEGKPIDVTQYQLPASLISNLNSLTLNLEDLTTEPGDWKAGATIFQRNTDRYNLNLKNHKSTNYVKKVYLDYTSKKYYKILHNQMGISGEQPSSLEFLFKKIKLHFANQHPLGIFKTFPLHEKIIYIGGIHVEEKKILTEKIKKQNNKKPQCIVLVSFGTVKVSGDFTPENVEIMFDRFSRFKKCKFIVRINKKLLPKNYNKNQIKVTDEYINQQGIL
uniref:glucuronosyltransferase n=1 Tax=Meloidogyne floridensis TaxID=298350 RepID=A0A915NV04_9BILA